MIAAMDAPMLEDVCEKMEIDVPEMYLELNVVPNAYTYGDDKPFIVVTSGLIETIPDELIPSVLAHECGHIVCHHTLYTTMGSLILNGMASMIPAALRALVTLPLQMAFAYWMRCSEFSADRAAMIYDGNSDHMIEVCMRLAGYGKFIDDKADPEVFIRQAEEYIKKYTWAKENASEPKAKKDIDPQVKLSIKEVETRLKKSLGSRVKIKITDPNTGKGKLVIDYKNNEDLDRLIELLG